MISLPIWFTQSVLGTGKWNQLIYVVPIYIVLIVALVIVSVYPIEYAKVDLSFYGRLNCLRRLALLTL